MLYESEPLRPRPSVFHARVGDKRRTVIPVQAVLFVLGVSAGALISAYFTSVGYFEKRLECFRLFGIQSLIVFGSQFVTTILQTRFDEHFDREYGIVATVGFRIIATGCCGALLLMTCPLISSEVVLYVLGCALSCLATSQASSSSQLGSAIASGNNALVITGLRLGGIIPLVAVFLTGFSPDASFSRAFSFYSCVGGVSIGGVALFAYCHYLAATTGETSEDTIGVQEGTEQALRRTYSSLSASMPATTVDSEEGVNATGYGWQICLAILFFCTLLPTPLFPGLGPHNAQFLVMAKIVGDAVGCLTGLYHSSVIRAGAHFGAPLKVICYVVALIRVVATYFLVLSLVQNGDADVSTNSDVNVVKMCTSFGAFFAVGQHVAILEDLEPQLQLPADQSKRVARRSLVMQFMGSFLGVGIGLVILAYL